MKNRGIHAVASVLLFTHLLWSGLASASSPNDPYYQYQTAFHTSTLGATIADAWELKTDASKVIVAVIDTGAEVSHPDLKANLWINSREIPGNGIDDDGNGYVDDVHGYDFINESGDLTDTWGHGTIVAGIIGAVGNNKIGTAGVAWKAQLMILRVFGDLGSTGQVSNFIRAIDYAIRNGANIINASWRIISSNSSSPGENRIPALEDAIQRAKDAGILVVAAAGNNAVNLDQVPVVPAAYSTDFNNVIAVAGLDEHGELLEESNFGKDTVTCAAPGEGILGPYIGHTYASLTGTSASAAFVTGAAALMLASRPDLDPSELRDMIIKTSQHSKSLSDLISSGNVVDPHASLLASLQTGQKSGDAASSKASPQGDTTSPNPNVAGGGCSLIPE